MAADVDARAMLATATARGAHARPRCARHESGCARRRRRRVVVANANANANDDDARGGGRRETLVALASSLAVCAPFVRAREGGGATARAGVR